MKGIKQSGCTEEKRRSKDIWGNGTAEEPFA
jgi:hypothetical protein